MQRTHILVAAGGPGGCDCSDAEQNNITKGVNWNVHYRCIDRQTYRVKASPGAVLGHDETMTQELPNLETSWVSQEASPFGLEWQVWPSSLRSSPPANWIRLLPRIIPCMCMSARVWRCARKSVKPGFKNRVFLELTLASDNHPIYFTRERNGNIVCTHQAPCPFLPRPRGQIHNSTTKSWEALSENIY